MNSVWEPGCLEGLIGGETATPFKGAMKKGPWLVALGIFLLGMEKLLKLCGDYFIKHEIKILIKQPGFNGK